MADQMNARPHPGPLPREEGAASDADQMFGCPGQLRRLTFISATRRTTIHDTRLIRTRRMFLPLLGERAGVRAAVGLISLLLLSAAFVHAQSYSIDWFTLDGGGGNSTGGVYSVSGTIGQPDGSGAMTGGNYSVTGGFWSLFAVQTPGAPLLRIFFTGTNTAVVAWPAPSTGFTLQQNTNLLIAAGWVNATNTVNVVGSENQIIVSPPTGNRYYRLYLP